MLRRDGSVLGIADFLQPPAGIDADHDAPAAEIIDGRIPDPHSEDRRAYIRLPFGGKVGHDPVGIHRGRVKPCQLRVLMDRHLQEDIAFKRLHGLREGLRQRLILRMREPDHAITAVGIVRLLNKDRLLGVGERGDLVKGQRPIIRGEPVPVDAAGQGLGLRNTGEKAVEHAFAFKADCLLAVIHIRINIGKKHFRRDIGRMKIPARRLHLAVSQRTYPVRRVIGANLPGLSPRKPRISHEPAKRRENIRHRNRAVADPVRHFPVADDVGKIRKDIQAPLNPFSQRSFSYIFQIHGLVPSLLESVFSFFRWMRFPAAPRIRPR